MDEEKQREINNKERHLANIVREIGLAEAQLPQIEQRKEILVREKSLSEQQMKLALEHFVVLRPTWEFETVPEYLDILKQINTLNHEKRMLEFDTISMRINEQTVAVNAQLDSLRTEKARIDTWMLENIEKGDDTNGQPTE